MNTKKETNFSVDQIVKALEASPELLSKAMERISDRNNKGSVPAFRILGTEEKEIVTNKMEGTKIVRGDKVKVKHYIIKTLRDDILSIPEFCLKDYGINPNSIAFIDDDGLTNAEIATIKNTGAF